MRLIIDRIEENIAVCEKEDLSHIDIPLPHLPEGTKEGSVILVDENGKYTLDVKQEDERRKKLLEMQKKLFSGKKNQ